MPRALLVFMLLAACGGGAHAYAARRYEPARDCVDPGTGLDVLPGPPAAANCLPQCLVQNGDVYVSNECPPYPPGIDASQAHPACPAAVAAWRRNDTCLTDGGTAHPADAGDAGDAR